jgi:hypothetical protein
VNLTPSHEGAFLAGVGLWVLIWASVWKADDIAGAMRIERWFNSTRCLRWFGQHKSTSLLGTELVNYGTHGLDALGVSFSLHTIQPLYQHRGQPLLDETAALRAWLRKRPADGSDYLFTSQKGGRLCRTQFFRNFQTVAESAGLPVEKRHPHVLKHSLASHSVAWNCNLALIRQALGHRSISSTMQYIGTSDEQAAEALQRALMGLF